MENGVLARVRFVSFHEDRGYCNHIGKYESNCRPSLAPLSGELAGRRPD